MSDHTLVPQHQKSRKLNSLISDVQVCGWPDEMSASASFSSKRREELLAVMSGLLPVRVENTNENEPGT